jgi:hypothetical protein
MYYAYALVHKDKDGYEHPLEIDDKVVYLFRTTAGAERVLEQWKVSTDHYIKNGRCEITYVPRKFWFDKRIEKQVYPSEERVRELKLILNTVKIKRVKLV